LDGEAIDEIRDVLEWGVGFWVETTSSGVVGLAVAGLTLAAAFFFGFPAVGLWGCCRFRLGLLRPGLLPGGGRFRLLGRFRDQLRRGIRFGG
jgi:hypothetical protein